MTARPMLSLVMIMRDAEGEIEDCLASCAGAVEEMVVCDTGSRDRSVAKVKKFFRRWQEESPGRRALLCRFRWRDDFAAARNYALGKATGLWALLLDSDERLSEGGGGELSRLAAELSADRLPAGCALAAPYSAGTGAPDVLEILRRNVDLAGEPAAGEADDLAVRMARLHPGLRYRGEVHEQLFWADGHPLRVAVVPPERLRILHTGYRAGEKEKKVARNYRLLRREAERGGRTYMLDCYLAQMYLDTGAYADAARHARLALASARPVHDSFRPYGLLYAALAPMEERDASRAPEVDALLEEGIAAYPLYPYFYYLRGGRRWNRGEEDGLADLERAAALAAEFPTRFPDQEFHFRSLLGSLYHALSQIYEERGETEKATAAREKESEFSS